MGVLLGPEHFCPCMELLLLIYNPLALAGSNEEARHKANVQRSRILQFACASDAASCT
jgi:hypothetical protein